MGREQGFNHWNFLEFTLAAAEGGHEGLLGTVDRNTLMPLLTGGLPSKDDESPKGVARRLGLLKAWNTVDSLRGILPNWSLAWDAFEAIELGMSSAAE
jgi:hypothetical protein